MKIKVTKTDAATLRKIARLMQQAEELFDALDNSTKEQVLEYHTNETTLNHCVRWGAQNSEEIAEALKIEKEVTEW